MSELFRKEAVHHVTRRLAGEVVLASSMSSRLLTGLVVGIVAAAVLFAASASYARKETVVGWLAPDAGLIRMSARQGGILEAIHVREGQAVQVGEPLATLRLAAALSEGDSFAAVSRSLAAQGQALSAQSQATRQTLEAERRQLRARRDALTRELAETRRRRDLQLERVELARQQAARGEAVAAQGYMTRSDLESLRSNVLALDVDAGELSAAVLTYERELAETDARLAAIPIDLQAARAEEARALAGLDQERIRTEGEATYRVVSTVAGRVMALPLQAGQTAPPGGVVAVVTPQASRLEAELYAPSRAAGFVREGQPVRLMYQAFPHQKFGTGEGVVVGVSRTVLAPSEVAIPGLEVQEPVFRVRVRLNRDSVTAYGETLPLQPGMLLSADVVIDRRSLLEWLLDPLYAAGRRG